MADEIGNHFRARLPCSRNRIQESRTAVPRTLFFPDGPDEFVTFDLLGPLPCPAWRNLDILVITVWGKPPVRGDTTPRHEPGTGRDQSRNTPLGGSAGQPPWAGVQGAPGPHMKRTL